MHTAVKIRPVTIDDLDALYYLSKNIGYGITHLPPNMDLITSKIQHSIQSFAKNVETIQDELYFFVMEDVQFQKVIGSCGIISQANVKHPFYTYKIIQQIHNSESLHISHTNNFLQLTNDYQGLSEVGMLAILPEHQHHHYGKFLSRSRFLFLADNQHRASEKIITQIRGAVDENGHSIFWRALGKKFIELPFLEIDSLIAKGEERFIAELLPDAPVPLELLSEEVRAIIGIPHPHSKPAYTLLAKEGFTFENYVNIFEGGPTLELYLKENPTINHSRKVHIQNIMPNINSDTYMIATINKTFNACLGELLFNPDETVSITQQTADILNVKIGDNLRISL